MRRISIGIAIVLVAGVASATDLFTLNVPVQVSHLNSLVTQVRVNCHLQGRDAITGNLVNFGFPTGKSQDFTVAGGAFTGAARIVFTNTDFSAAELGNLTSVSNGNCHLILIAGGNQYQPYASSTGPVLGHQPGTAFSTQVTFTIH